MYDRDHGRAAGSDLARSKPAAEARGPESRSADNGPTQVDPLLRTLSAGPGVSPGRTRALLGLTISRTPYRAQRSLLELQRSHGNRHVRRLISRSLETEGETVDRPEIEGAIESARGSGQALDSGVRRRMDSAFGADFSGVRVHTDDRADRLNRSLDARAFTTGQDIFFRQGEYQPSSSAGGTLLAHELTHVVQQTGNVRAKLTIGQPGDRYEQEADRVAEQVVRMPESSGVEQAGRARTMCPECEEEQSLQTSTTSLQRGLATSGSSGAAQSLMETDEGTETIAVNRLENEATTTVNGGGGTASSSCSVTGSFTTIPSGSLAATVSGGRLRASFSMIGEFSPSIPCNCSGGEYRQYVRGRFTRNGSNVTHRLCGTNLHPTNYQEDCGIFGGTTYKYGYRSIHFGNSYFTNPDQATGCRFVGYDSPGIGGASGDTVAVNLDFLGALIDTDNGNKVLAASAWSVVGSATLP
jgi:hypothetical protein